MTWGVWDWSGTVGADRAREPGQGESIKVVVVESRESIRWCELKIAGGDKHVLAGGVLLKPRKSEILYRWCRQCSGSCKPRLILADEERSWKGIVEGAGDMWNQSVKFGGVEFGEGELAAVDVEVAVVVWEKDQATDMLVVGTQESSCCLASYLPSFRLRLRGFDLCNYGPPAYSLQSLALLVLVGVGQVISSEYDYCTQWKTMFLHRCR